MTDSHVRDAFWQASCDFPADLAEAAAYLLAEGLGCPAEVQDLSTMLRAENAEVSVVVLAFDAPPPEDLGPRVEACLAPLGQAPVTLRTRRRDDDWKEGWKAFFRTTRISDRVAVRPPWEPNDPEAQVHVIIDPGMAFGTGTHATTRGVIRLLDGVLARHPGRPGVPPGRVLDLGTGSGILAIVAALLGHDAVGVEIDPVALENAAHNLRLNGVEDRVRLVEGSVDAVPGPFPGVVANILAGTLIELAAPIRAQVGADLVLSGILGPQAEAVVAAYPDLRLVERVDDGEWAILHLAVR